MNELIDNFFNVQVIVDSLPLLFKGFVDTFRLVLLAFCLGAVLAFPLVGMHTSRYGWMRRAALFYIDVARSLPPLVSLIVVFYLMPPIGPFSLTVFQSAVLTFGLVQAAYISEIYRGGLAAVGVGQREAGTALGMSRSTILRFVVAPQVFRIIIPPLTSQSTQLVRDSALAFFIGYSELTTRATQMASLSGNASPYILAAIMFMIVLGPLQLFSRALEYRRKLTPQ